MTSKTRAATSTHKTVSVKAVLGAQSLKKLTKLLLFIAKQEQAIELQRQFLANNEIMEPYSLFQRIDRGEDGFVTSIEILNFLRDNGIHHVTEADCYYLVKFFDADEDGRLNYPDFMQMILPCDNPYLRAVATQRPNQYINKFDFLTLDVERDLTKLLLSEIDMHKKSEKLKQELESMADYSEDSVYSAIDDWGYGFVDQKNLMNYFRKQKRVPTDEACVAIIRRLDLDADGKLKREEYLDGLRPQEPYSKMIIRERMTKKDQLLRIKKQNKVDISKGKRVNKKAEEGAVEDGLRVQAIDRSYKEVLSTSPLKHRVNLDLYGTPSKNQSPQRRSQDLNASGYAQRSRSRTPNKTAQPMRVSYSQNQFVSPQQVQQQVGRNSKLGSSSKTFNKTNGFDQSTIASPSKLKMSGVTSMMQSQYKTPQKFTSSQKGRGQQPIDSMFNMSANNYDDCNLAMSHLQVNSISQSTTEVNLVNIFREQLTLERQLERSKIDLCLRTDFNLIDAFRIFDNEGKGWIAASELKDGLQLFDIFVQPEDIQFFMKRYDKDEDGRLRYSEFCDAFLPTDAFHASLLAKKAPMHMHQAQLPKDKIFYAETKTLFVQTWKIHISNENEAERIRVQLQCQKDFNAYHYFQACDTKNDGVIDKEEIKELLIKYNLYVSEKEICALIDRYDRTRDGKITYSEFVDELSSRSARR